MKRLFGVLLVLVFMFALISCNENDVLPDVPLYGSLSVSTGDVARTIEPEIGDITCAGYKVIGTYLTDPDSTFEQDFTGHSVTIDNLLVGRWIVYVEGYNADGLKIATSSAKNVNIQPTKTSSESFRLEYLTTGSGTLSLSVMVPEDEDGVGKVVFTVGDQSFIVDCHSDAVDGCVSYTYTGTFPAGEYSVSATAQTSEGVKVGITLREIAHVHTNLTASKAWSLPSSTIAPTMSPNGGLVAKDSTVSIYSETDGALIYYTVDGSTPTTSSAKYGTPITISKNTTVKAIAYSAGLYISNVSSVDFHVKAEAPSSSFAAGTYDEAKTVVLSTSTGGSTIYYTMDGTTPTTSSSVYAEALSITQNTTVKAIAVNSEFDDSDVFSIDYKIKATTPEASVESGSYGIALTVSLSCSTPQSTIYYTVDGSDPKTNGIVYTDSLIISESTTVKAVSKTDKHEFSDIVELTYTIINPKLEAPVITPNGGQSNSSISVSMTAFEGASIYYTTDGSVPTSSSTRYNEPIMIGSTSIVKAIAVKDTFVDSDVAEATFTINGRLSVFSVYGPTHYTVSIVKPVSWTDDAVLVPGIYGVLHAGLSYENSDVISYKWYVDDVLVSSESDVSFGPEWAGYTALTAGLHCISLEVSINSRTYYDSIIVSVSELGDVYSPLPPGIAGPAGGIIFYDKGYYSDGWRYLEAAPEDIEIGNTTMFPFGYYRTSASGDNLYVNGTTTFNEANCTGTAIGTGKSNTAKLVAAMGSSAYQNDKSSSSNSVKVGDYAARLCDNYSYGGYSDWFLPSKDELNLMTSLIMNGLGRFAEYEYYWSSSENSSFANYAWVHTFGIGYQFSDIPRGDTRRVRAIRAF